MTNKLNNPFKITELINTVNELDINKQDTLISGTNIKTINGSSVLGNGNLTVTADTNDCVHKTGDETISGTKTFTGGTARIKISRGSAAYTEIMTTKGDANYTRTGGFRNIENNGINESLMYITNNDGSSIHGSISILKNTTTGDVYTSAPTPATSDNSTKIATTAFVKAQGYAVDSNVVHKTGNETITGSKTFTSYQYIKNIDCSIANPPASTSWRYIDCIDSNNVRIGVIGSQINTDGTRGVYLQAGNEGGISVFTNGTTVYTSTVTPPASDNSTKIATTAWVKNQGYMSSDNIFPNNTWVPVGDDAYIGDHNQSGAVCIKGNNDNTKLLLINRAQNVDLGFYIDENDNNALKLTSPWYSSTAWGSVTAMVAQSLSGNGYVKFNHGLIIQWGYSNQYGSSKTVTLPTPFTSTNYAVTISRYAAEWTEGVIMQTNNYTQTSFNFTANDPGVHWIAIGY